MTKLALGEHHDDELVSRHLGPKTFRHQDTLRHQIVVRSVLGPTCPCSMDSMESRVYETVDNETEVSIGICRWLGEVRRQQNSVYWMVDPEIERVESTFDDRSEANIDQLDRLDRLYTWFFVFA